MRSIPQALQTHLDSGVTTLAWCWRMTRRDGARLGFTDHDQPLFFDGTTFEAASGFTATEIKASAGFAVDNLEVQSALRSDTLDEADLARGIFDNAGIEIFRVNWQDPNQRVRLHVGSVGEVKRNGSAFFAEVRGLMHQLDQPTGRLYQHTCDATLGDARCSVDHTSAAWSFGSIVLASDGYRVTVASPTIAYAATTFDRGSLIVSTSSQADMQLDIRQTAVSTTGVDIELWQTPSVPIAVGASVRVTAGCDKRLQTCRDKFSNGVNFRGFPSIPGNDFVTAVAAPGSVPKVGSST